MKRSPFVHYHFMNNNNKFYGQVINANKMITIFIFRYLINFYSFSTNLDSTQFNYGGNIKIIEDYDSNEDYDQETPQNVPDKFVVELKQTRSDEIDDVIKSTVNITTTTSIYDFQGNQIIHAMLIRFFFVRLFPKNSI